MEGLSGGFLCRHHATPPEGKVGGVPVLLLGLGLRTIFMHSSIELVEILFLGLGLHFMHTLIALVKLIMIDYLETTPSLP